MYFIIELLVLYIILNNVNNVMTDIHKIYVKMYIPSAKNQGAASCNFMQTCKLVPFK